MDYINDTYSWFDDPEFKKNQESLLERNNDIKDIMKKNDAFDMDNVFNSKDHLQDQNLKVPNLTGNSQFSAFALNNPIPNDAFVNNKIAENNKPITEVGMQKSDKDTIESTKKFVTKIPVIGKFASFFKAIGDAGIKIGEVAAGEKGKDIATGVFDPFSAQVKVLKDDDSTFLEKATAINTPFLAGFMGGANKTLKKEHERLWTLEHTKREQSQRQADGLQSLSNLTELRKQQEKFII